jgi:hypothetical protein
MPALSATANVPQSQFLAMPHKFRAFVAGFGSGKTWVGCQSMCTHFWRHPRIKAGYFAPTFPHIRDIFYPTIEEVADTMGLRVVTRVSDKEVDFYSGKIYRGTALCRSMNNPASIIGFKIGHAMIDELDVMTTEKARLSWMKIIARMRYDEPGLRNGIDVTTTPEGFKFTHEMFVQALTERPELAGTYGLLQASTYDNAANLPRDYITSLEQTYPKELIGAYLRGQFTNLQSGTVYRSYDRTRCGSNETIQPNEPLFIGMDFNVDHMAATVYVKRDKVWHAVDELKDIYDTPAMIGIINGRWKDKGHKIYVYPDASGKNRKSNDASTSDIALLQQAGYSVRVNASNPAVKNRIMAVNKALEDGTLRVNVRACPTVAKNLEHQAYDKNGEPDKKSGTDHQNDATGYPIAYEMPIVKPVLITPVRFGY